MKVFRSAAVAFFVLLSMLVCAGKTVGVGAVGCGGRSVERDYFSAMLRKF